MSQQDFFFLYSPFQNELIASSGEPYILNPHNVSARTAQGSSNDVVVEVLVRGELQLDRYSTEYGRFFSSHRLEAELGQSTIEIQ
jgi:hypothetical protein